MSNLKAAAAAMNAAANNPPPQPINPATYYNPIQNGGSMQNIQNQIKLRRRALGWTQRKLAKEAGMSQGTITRAERHGWISISCLLNIAHALGTTLNLIDS